MVSPKYACRDGSNRDIANIERTKKIKNPIGVGKKTTTSVPKQKVIIPASMPVRLPRESANEARNGLIMPTSD